MQKRKLIAYESCLLKPHEKNYLTHDLELAIVLALKLWRHYLYGETCRIFSVYKSINTTYNSNSVAWGQNSYSKQRDIDSAQLKWGEEVNA
ncbi:CCHC-type integrase [Gossypium australe]|uniref:CCHC-type integrase n=1 Tax=Gossypium australe TaxID=47621 RepID=A0A5B6VLU6_9ROSI|nr:CCHC-type integrase [Gossypium australe]